VGVSLDFQLLSTLHVNSPTCKSPSSRKRTFWWVDTQRACRGPRWRREPGKRTARGRPTYHPTQLRVRSGAGTSCPRITSLTTLLLITCVSYRYTCWACGPRSSPRRAPLPQVATDSCIFLRRQDCRSCRRASSLRSRSPSAASSSNPSCLNPFYPPTGPNRPPQLPVHPTRMRTTSRSTRSSQGDSGAHLRARSAARSCTAYTPQTRGSSASAPPFPRCAPASAAATVRSCGASLALGVVRRRGGAGAHSGRRWRRCGDGRVCRPAVGCAYRARGGALVSRGHGDARARARQGAARLSQRHAAKRRGGSRDRQAG